MANFILTANAVNDLKDIGRFTQKRWGREQRNKYLKILDDSFLDLARNPSMGRESNEIRSGYYKSPTGSHVIFYRNAAEGLIEIVRILHESMDVEILRSKTEN